MPADRVLDPFCGRGTTNYAARLAGLESLGVDSSPVAVAIAGAKLVDPTPDEIVAEALEILSANQVPTEVPEGEFWSLAFHPEVLWNLCRLRESLMSACDSSRRLALRGIILGALHGPQQKETPTYLSNQCPRTYAPKPAYATGYWRSRGLTPMHRNILDVIRIRAGRYFAEHLPARGTVRLSDSRTQEWLQDRESDEPYDWVITSPPYYGMRTYVPDQWLRHWFVGGSPHVAYSSEQQIIHSSPDAFAADLRAVWNNVAAVTRPTARLVVRFGGISDRRAEPMQLLKESFRGTAWRMTTAKHAGSAHAGRRQADSFLRRRTKPTTEYDVWLQKR